ncbi:MAG: hypothetical protein ACRDDZ_10420 [Marinifilaceae bacterium]
MTKIENEIQYKAAMQRIEELLTMVDENTPESDVSSVELVLLSNLAADYDEYHYPISKPSLTDVLKLRMYETNMCLSTPKGMFIACEFHTTTLKKL